MPASPPNLIGVVVLDPGKVGVEVGLLFQRELLSINAAAHPQVTRAAGAVSPRQPYPRAAAVNTGNPNGVNGPVNPIPVVGL